MSAAILQGVPATTLDTDLCVRLRALPSVAKRVTTSLGCAPILS